MRESVEIYSLIYLTVIYKVIEQTMFNQLFTHMFVFPLLLRMFFVYMKCIKRVVEVTS